MQDLLPLIEPGIVMIFGAVLLFILNRAAAAFTLATGIRVEEKWIKDLHSALKSGVEAALAERSPGAGLEVIKAHAVHHARESVPDAIAGLVPGDGVLDRIALRYYREAMERLGLEMPPE